MHDVTRALAALGLLLVLCVTACGAPESAPAPAPAQPTTTGPTTTGPQVAPLLPSSRDAERLEPRVRDEIAAAIAAARPLLDGRALSGEELDVASRPCVLEQAHQLMDDAADCYSRVERAAPRDARWPYLLGHVHLGRSQREAALASFERALDLQPGDGPTLAWIGQVLYDLQRLDESRARLLEALVVDPDNAFALFRLGQLELQQGHPIDAVARLERVLALQPTASAAHHVLAQALREAGRDAEADDHARRAGQVRPGMQDPWLNAVKASASGERVHVDRGGRAFKRGDFETAEKEFRLALEDDPRSVDAWMNLGSLLSRRNDAAGAREALGHALALAPEDPDIHFNLGVVAAAEGKTSEAVSHYRDALHLDDLHVGAGQNLGNALLRLGKFEEAASRFRTVLAADPANAKARSAEASCLVELHRDADARASLEQGLVAAPGHPGLSAALGRLLATSRDAKVRDGARALALAQAAFTAQPDLESAEALAMAFAETGQFADAIRLQQLALDSARSANRPDLLDRIQGALDLYRKNQPLRLP